MPSRASSASSPRAAGSCASSSFQLEDVDELHPRVGVLLNVTPDHLDRHGTLAAYADAKLRLFARQDADDVAVLDDDDPWIAALADDELPGAARRVRIRLADAPQDLRDAFDDSVLAGSHNLENVLCAAAAAEAAGADRRGVLDAVRRFRPLAHRMERVGELGGVTYVNDSKATNQEAAIRALGAFSHGVHLILGGSLKGGDFAPLARAVATGPVAASYLIGAAADAIDGALVAEGVRRDALRLARRRARLPPRRPPRRATPCCSRRPAPRSTSSATSRTAATSSGRSSRSSPRDARRAQAPARHARRARARGRHDRARRLRRRDGLLGVERLRPRRARQLALLPRARGRLRPRPGCSRSRSARASTTARSASSPAGSCCSRAGC